MEQGEKKDKFISNIDGLLLDFSSCCWKTCDNELYQICIRPWAVNQYLWTLIDFLSYIFSVSEEYKDYTFDYDDMAG